MQSKIADLYRKFNLPEHLWRFSVLIIAKTYCVFGAECPAEAHVWMNWNMIRALVLMSILALGSAYPRWRLEGPLLCCGAWKAFMFYKLYVMDKGAAWWPLIASTLVAFVGIRK